MVISVGSVVLHSAGVTVSMMGAAVMAALSYSAEEVPAAVVMSKKPEPRGVVHTSW
jgi:hypothetical protein